MDHKCQHCGTDHKQFCTCGMKPGAANLTNKAGVYHLGGCAIWMSWGDDATAPACRTTKGSNQP